MAETDTRQNPATAKDSTDPQNLVDLAEARMAAAEHRLYNLSRLVSAWIWETDSEFRLTFVSFRVFDYLGIHPQELIGKKLSEIGAFVSLDDFPAGGEHHSTFRDVFFEIEGRDGKKNLFLMSGLPVFDQNDGTFLGIQGTAEDVTRHPRADEGFDSLFDALEQSLILVMITNSFGEIEYANQKFQDATGYSLEELKRMSPNELARLTDDEFDTKWSSIRDGKEWHGPVEYRRKHGGFLQATEMIAPIRAADNNVQRYAWIAEDATARRIYNRHLPSTDESSLFSDMPSRIRNAINLILSSENSVIGKLQMNNEAMAAAVERMPFGIAIIDAYGHPLYANRVAKEILNHNDGLTAGRDGLQGERNGQVVKLKERIWRTEARQRGKKSELVRAFAIDRPSGDRPYAVVVTPLRAQSHYFNNDRPAALVFFSDPETHPEIDPDKLSSLYGLTPAEARLATLLAQDLSLADAAEELGVSQHTVRTHIKRIFAKTTTERQSGLIRLLLSGPAPIAGD